VTNESSNTNESSSSATGSTEESSSSTTTTTGDADLSTTFPEGDEEPVVVDDGPSEPDRAETIASMDVDPDAPEICKDPESDAAKAAARQAAVDVEMQFRAKEAAEKQYTTYHQSKKSWEKKTKEKTDETAVSRERFMSNSDKIAVNKVKITAAEA